MGGYEATANSGVPSRVRIPEKHPKLTCFGSIFDLFAGIEFFDSDVLLREFFKHFMFPERGNSDRTGFSSCQKNQYEKNEVFGGYETKKWFKTPILTEAPQNPGF